FLLLLLPPSFSTLSPYTTLFRSVPAPFLFTIPIELASFVLATSGSVQQGFIRNASRSLCSPWLAQALRIKPYTFGGLELSEAKIDRKSTRLNSSHVEISYAVFCL